MLDIDRRVDDQSYFAMHWHGNYSLTKSFWLNLTAINLAIIAVQQILAETLQYNFKLPSFALAFLVWIWSAGGVWRSADRYSKLPGSGVWGNVACLIVILQGLSWFVQLREVLS